MRKRVILALLLVVALAVTTGCSLIVKDEAVDRETPIVEVAGTTITKAQVTEQINAYQDYQEYMYYMYGMSYDRTNAAAVEEARTAAVDMLIEDAVLTKKTADTGMDVLSEEELAAAQETADNAWNNYLDSVKSNYFADTELEGEELDAAVEAKLVELGSAGKEELLESAKASKAREKLRADAIKDVVVTDEEVAAEYETRKGAAMTNYGNNPATYGTDVQNGSTIYYVPAGYRYVKNILIKLKDEDDAKIKELGSQISAKQSELTTAEDSLAALGEDASADDENTAKNRADLTATKETLTAEIAELNTQLDAAKEQAYAAIQPTADEVLAKIAAGEDFDALMETYGEDAGMQSSPAKENGYPVSADSTNWVTEFKDASMALEKVGDVSPAIRTNYGLHIIKYVSDAVEGEVGLDAVKDTVYSELLTAKQDDAYNAALDAWVKEANAKIYMDRLN